LLARIDQAILVQAGLSDLADALPARSPLFALCSHRRFG
jgi:hypothetical protein